LQGDTEAAARLHAAVASSVAGAAPLCLISGGETTVRLGARHGKGGRNQHFVLATALALASNPELGSRRWALLSCGTDGTDGPTPAAGAIADHNTLPRAGQAGMDAARFLRRRDSYRFFQRIGDLILTGPTGTNVMDLRVLLLHP
jgi:hydroxypyruvate reductase